MTSWIWVIDWISEIAKPTTRAVISIGAAELGGDEHGPAWPMSRTALVFISRLR